MAQHEYTVCETSSTCISKPTLTMPSQHSLLCWMHYEWLRLCDRLSTLWQLAFLDASPLHAFVSEPSDVSTQHGNSGLAVSGTATHQQRTKNFWRESA